MTLQKVGRSLLVRDKPVTGVVISLIALFVVYVGLSTNLPPGSPTIWVALPSVIFFAICYFLFKSIARVVQFDLDARMVRIKKDRIEHSFDSIKHLRIMPFTVQTPSEPILESSETRYEAQIVFANETTIGLATSGDRYALESQLKTLGEQAGLAAKLYLPNV